MIAQPIPQPKYNIGDVVYFAGKRLVTEPATCPDCLDIGKWDVSTPAGEEFQVWCPRCATFSSDKPRTRRWEPTVDRLTIGSVQINTHDDCPVKYMCKETGIGTGTLYPEHMLYTDEASAQKAVEGLCTAELPGSIEYKREEARVSTATILNLKLDEERNRRWDYQFKLEDVQKAFYDITDPQEFRERVKEIIE